MQRASVSLQRHTHMFAGSYFSEPIGLAQTVSSISVGRCNDLVIAPHTGTGGMSQFFRLNLKVHIGRPREGKIM